MIYDIYIYIHIYINKIRKTSPDVVIKTILEYCLYYKIKCLRFIS